MSYELCAEHLKLGMNFSTTEFWDAALCPGLLHQTGLSPPEKARRTHSQDTRVITTYIIQGRRINRSQPLQAHIRSTCPQTMSSRPPCFGKDATLFVRHCREGTVENAPPRKRIGPPYTPFPGYSEIARPVLETRTLRNLERPLPCGSRLLPSAGDSKARSARV